MKIFIRILFFTGLALLVLNIYGLFRTMRNPEVYTLEETLHNRVNDVTIRYPEIRKQLNRKPGESGVDFGTRITHVVANGFAHYWKADGTEKFHLRVPAWDNYLLYAASYINPGKYKRYEFCNYKKNLERGVGLCSTHSTIVKGVLLDNGIKAELLDVGGHHVVVRAELDDTDTWMLDPDFGIVVPYDTAAISANPELVRASYKDMASLYYPDAIDPYTPDILVDIFGKKLHVYTLTNWFETFSYVVIWIIPFLLMLPVAISLFKRQEPSA